MWPQATLGPHYLTTSTTVPKTAPAKGRDLIFVEQTPKWKFFWKQYKALLYSVDSRGRYTGFQYQFHELPVI